MILLRSGNSSSLISLIGLWKNRSRYCTSSRVFLSYTKLMAMPLRAQRPVRPIRCKYVSGSTWCDETEYENSSWRKGSRAYLAVWFHRQVIIDYERHLQDVDAAGQQVGGDENFGLALPELVDHFISLLHSNQRTSTKREKE